MLLLINIHCRIKYIYFHILVHKECLLAIQPIWKFKLDACPWLCTECRVTHCSKCQKVKQVIVTEIKLMTKTNLI